MLSQFAATYGVRWPKMSLGRLVRWRTLLLGVVCAAAPASGPTAESAQPARPSPVFIDVAKDAGIDFIYFNGMTGEFYFPESMGAGVALLDYDNDGDLDVYLCQGHLLGKGKTLKDALFPPRAGEAMGGRLYRNDLTVDGNGNPILRFSDVTATSGIEANGYGMGVAAGDIDNDGYVDLYLTNFGHNQLWHNDGDGSFTEITRTAGVDDERWSVSAAFLDYDRDGWLDLYVGNYVNFTLGNHKKCYAPSSARDYCSPLAYQGLPDRLFHNRGDGTFEDVSARSRVGTETRNGLGAVVADLNGDGWPDIYVADDGQPNQLWMSQQDGTFRNDAVLAGVAVDMNGNAQASMGVDAADFDGDGDEDLFLTHLLGETNTIYVNDGQGWFEDRSLVTGLAAPSKGLTAFGTAWIDYDNDGLLDLFTANGEVKSIAARIAAGSKFPLEQPNQLFRNLGNGHFADVSTSAGEVLQRLAVSRGAAVGDIDNDGDCDILMLNNNGPARLLLNRIGRRNHWLGLDLHAPSGRPALGARVEVLRGPAKPLWRRARADGSYASANDPRVLIGLGAGHGLQTVRVHWPLGKVEEWSDLAVNRYHMLNEGAGRAVDTK